MDNIFKALNHYCLVYINDVLVFSKIIEQHKDDVLAIIQGRTDHGIILSKTSAFMLNKKLSSWV